MTFSMQIALTKFLIKQVFVSSCCLTLFSNATLIRQMLNSLTFTSITSNKSQVLKFLYCVALLITLRLHIGNE